MQPYRNGTVVCGWGQSCKQKNAKLEKVNKMDTQWGRNHTQKKGFPIEVLKKNAKNLNELTLNHVLPGSITLTDEWKVYCKKRSF